MDRLRLKLPRIQHPKSKIAFALLFALPLCWLFAGPIFKRQSFAYRDVSHYYFPLWREVASAWRTTFSVRRLEMPLWNPWENGGQPLAADGTSCVFYPATWLLAGPLPYPLGMKLLIAVHFGGAALAMSFVARKLGSSWQAAALAGLSYAFGGYLISQHANPIYLYGATWLPLVMYCGWQIFQLGQWRYVLGLAAALSLMVLGGDPQTAYHAALMLIMVPVVRLFRAPASQDVQSAQTPLRLTKRTGLLLVSSVLALALSAVQVISSSELASHSQRATFEKPRSIWEKLAARTASNDSPQAKRERDKESDAATERPIYDFSVPPFRMAELLWPNASGKNYPVFTRWTKSALGEGRTWNASLYFGLLPLVLSLAACRWRCCALRRWLMFVAVIALISSFGRYGIGSLCNTIASLLGRQSQFNEAMGGLYWLEVQLLPCYTFFRYPAKWLVLLAFASSLLAAHGWDELHTEKINKASRYLLLSALSITAFAMLAMPLLKSYWLNATSHATPSSVFGPLDVNSAWHTIWISLLHSVIVAVTLLILIHPRIFRRRFAAGALLVITAVDLLAAHQWQLCTVEDRLLEHPSMGWTLLKTGSMSAEDPVYEFRNVDRPRAWSESSSPTRVFEAVSWEIATLYGKHNLNHYDPKLVSVRSDSSLTVRESVALINELRSKEPHRVRQVWKIIDPNYLIAVRTKNVEKRAYSLPGDVFYVPRARAAPRAWVAFNWKDGPAIPATNHRSAWKDWMRGTLDLTSDATRAPVLHRDASNMSALDLPLGGNGEIVSARCQDQGPNSVAISVVIERPGLLVLRDSYYPGWKADVLSDQTRQWQAEVRRVNVVQRGLLLPAGSHEIRLHYQPRHLRIAAATALMSWLVWLGLAVHSLGGIRRLRAGFSRLR